MKPAADAGGNAGVRGFLYPFGFGLSYTSFQYSDLHADVSSFKTKGEVAINFTVKNTGERAGDEIAQLYIHEQVSSVTTYDRRLKGFDRITLQPGEEKKVSMILRARDFSLLNRDMKRMVEPGKFDIMVGASSEDIRLKQTILLPGQAIIEPSGSHKK
jgi:beta-glucosidase